MNPYRPSQCPLCRSAYTHFPKVITALPGGADRSSLPDQPTSRPPAGPQVSEQLHLFLAKAFPAEYAERAQETSGLSVCVSGPCAGKGHSAQPQHS
jgi:hypothetical protein